MYPFVMNERETKELASQLRKPKGPMGLNVAEQLYKTNKGMIGSTIDHIDLRENNVVLELGHGNSAHLESLFKRESNIIYHGLELSRLMYDEAQKINHRHIKAEKAFFKHYEGVTFPYGDQMFDKIFTVNTLYFWDHPEKLLGEIRRVLKDNGFFAVAFVPEKTLLKLGFSKYGFAAYSEGKFKKLMTNNRFDIENLIRKSESVVSNEGEAVRREYVIGLMRKK